LRLLGVIDPHRDRRSPSGHDHLGGLVDRLRPAVWRRLAAHAAPGAVDDRSRFAERAGDAAAGAAGGAGDDGDVTGERLVGCLSASSGAGAHWDLRGCIHEWSFTYPWHYEWSFIICQG
jgi:hypothetical protein